MKKYCGECGTPAMANMLKCPKCGSTGWSEVVPALQAKTSDLSARGSAQDRQVRGVPPVTTSSRGRMAGPLTAINSAMRNTFKFSGRASRSEFWWFMLFFYVTLIGLLFLVEWGQDRYGDGSPLLVFLSIVLIVFFIWITIAHLSIQVRRLHDMNNSASWIFLMFVPLLSLALLIMSCRRGTIGPNNYGEEPEYYL
jgi:uncharacterized membrane protein YhaH (DUF805 family)